MAREFTANAAVLKELAEDEKLIWKGAPEAFPLMADDNRKGLVGRWLGCIVAAVVIIVGFILLSASASTSVWVLIIALAVVAYLAGLPLIDKGNVYKKCKYYITDRRVLLHYRENELFSLPLSGLKHEISPAQPGCIHVDLGTRVGIKANKRRVAAFVPKKDENGVITGLVLYNLEDNNTIREIFS